MAKGVGLLGIAGGLITFGLICNVTSDPQGGLASALFTLAASTSGAVFVGRRLSEGSDSIEQKNRETPQYGPPTYRR
jgi:hypothetical protein